jgi:toxin ParE1/3/4
MSRFSISNAAKADINDIWDYIAEDNLSAANRLIDRFEQVFGNLADQPGIGRLRQELGYELRAFVVGAYVVFYRPTSAGIEIARVLHGARDIERMFPRNTE